MLLPFFRLSGAVGFGRTCAVPISPSISKAIRAVRRKLGDPPQNDREANELYFAVARLLQKGERIVADGETLGEVLALAS